MAENESNKNKDFLFSNEILESEFTSFKKSLEEITLSPKSNVIKNSVYSKLKFCDLILIDNNSNFMDLKIKLEINPNKNTKTQFFLKDNVIKFKTVSELTNNILTRLNKEPSIYTISYFGNNLEKINSEIDINNYQGESIYVKICEKYNKRNNNNVNLTFNNIKNIYYRTFSNTQNGKKNKNYESNQKMPLLREKTVNINEKIIVQQKEKNLNNLIEETLNFNLALKNYKNQNSIKNNENESSKPRSTVKSLIKIDSSKKYTINKFPKFNSSPDKEKTVVLPDLNEEKSVDSFMNYKKKKKPEKLNNNGIVIKKRILEREKSDIFNSNINDSNINNNVLREVSKKRNSVIFSNCQKTIKNIQKSYDMLNSPNFPSADFISNNMNKYRAEKKRKRDSLASKDFEKLEKSKNYKSENKSANLEKIEKTLNKENNQNEINLIKQRNLNSIGKQREHKIININEFSKNEHNSSYLLTDQSFTKKIKPKIKHCNKILYNNKSNFSSDNFFNNKLNFKKARYERISSNSKSDFYDMDFLNKVITLNPDNSTSKFKKLISANSSLCFEQSKNSNKNSFNKLLLNKSNSNFYNSSNYIYFKQQFLNNFNYNFSKRSNEKTFEINDNKTFNSFYLTNGLKFGRNDLQIKTSQNSSRNFNKIIDTSKNHIIQNKSKENNVQSPEKVLIFYKTYSSKNGDGFGNLDNTKNNNEMKNANNIKATSNTNNIESIIPSVIDNKTYKNISDSIPKKSEFKSERAIDKTPNYKLKNISKFLNIIDSPFDFEYNFSRLFEKIENNDTSNLLNLNNNFNNSENTNFFNNPTINNKVFSPNLKLNSKFNSENDKYYKTNFFKDRYLSNKNHNKFSPEKLSYNYNKSAGKFKDLYSSKNKINNSNSYKIIPNVDKKTFEEVFATKKLIKNFITNNLNLIITNEFIEENLKILISNNIYKPKDICLHNIKNEKHENSNSIINDFNYSEDNLLNDLKNKNSVISNYNNNLITVETNPQENIQITEKEFQFAREFIFYNYLNCKALEKFFMKKLNRNDISKSNNIGGLINTSLNFFNNKEKDFNKNLNYTNLNSTAATENNWFNSVNHNLALEFFNTSNNSKQVSEFNAFIEELVSKSKKDISGILSFLNFISQNKMNLQIKNFALDLIFVNLYIIDAKNKSIDEKLIYSLIEYISNGDDKKVFFENYKRLHLLYNKKESEKEIKNFYKSKFLFLKNFLKMILKNSEDNIDLIKKSFDITDEEIYFILFSDINEIKQYISDDDFKKKITTIFNDLFNSLF